MKFFAFFALLLVICVVCTTAQDSGSGEESGEESGEGSGEESGEGSGQVTCPNSGPERFCRGRPSLPSCRGRRDEGNGGRGCITTRMWYYHERSGRCRKMRYLGCGGNSNRFCSRCECVRRCNR